METQILYNGINPFSNIGPVPLFSKRDAMVRYHDRWAVQSNVILQGVITGACQNSYNDIISKQASLINTFSQDFKSLVVNEENVNIFSADFANINAINFDSNKYVRVLPYSIELSCYPANLFSGVYGVLDVNNSINWSESEDSIITVTRDISAKGINTNSANRTNNALDNAKNWVQGLTGWNTSYFAHSLPVFIGFNPAVSPCVKTINEKIDRFNATYSVEETYRYDPKSSISYLLQYTTAFDLSDEEGIYNAQINGIIEGCPSQPDTSWSVVRNAYKNLNLYSITNFEFKKTFPDAPLLNPEFLSESVSERASTKTIEFSKSWDSDPRPIVLFDYEINSSKDLLADLITLSINGTISTRNTQKIRWERVVDYYENLNIFNILQNFYISKGYPYQLVRYPTNFTVTENQNEGVININASFDDRPQPSPPFDDIDYSISIEPPINQIIPVPVLCGKYFLIDLRAKKRGLISADGKTMKISNTPLVEETRGFAQFLVNKYLPAGSIKRVIKSDSVQYTKEGTAYSHDFDRSDSFMGPAFTF